MDFELMEALELLERERGVPAEVILDAMANALVAAYKRRPGAAEEARVTIDTETTEITVYAQELDEEGEVIREWEDTPEDFGEVAGRIAAQTFKQVMSQRLRDAKREQVFDVYEGREGDLVTGIVQQSDHRYSILDLGDAEALMPGSERIPYERLDRGARVKAVILEVRKETKGPQIVVSRSREDFIRRLFELEVPELVEAVVEIKEIAREAGHRTKIAVVSNDRNVDPVGACVGARGSRVRQVVNELRGEKVDIVEWREDSRQFIAEALSPAKVKDVRIDDETMTAEVIVPDHQLSLAIGKEGQNARLAARLSGYRIDIKSESEDLGLVPEGEEAAAAPGQEAAAAPGEEAAAAEAVTGEPTAEGAEVEDEAAGAEVAGAEAEDEAAGEEAPEAPDVSDVPDAEVVEAAERLDVADAEVPEVTEAVEPQAQAEAASAGEPEETVEEAAEEPEGGETVSVEAAPSGDQTAGQDRPDESAT